MPGGPAKPMHERATVELWSTLICCCIFALPPLVMLVLILARMQMRVNYVCGLLFWLAFTTVWETALGFGVAAMVKELRRRRQERSAGRETQYGMRK